MEIKTKTPTVKRTKQYKMLNGLKITKPIILALLALTIVFLIDIFTPLGIAVGVLYVFCFILVCRQTKKVIFTFAVITSLLTVAKIIVFFSPTTTYMAISNRAITITVITIIAILASKHRTLVDKITEERNDYISELEKMLIITSHKTRAPIATILGLLQLNTEEMSISDFKKTIGYLKASAEELDLFTREFTSHLNNLKIKTGENTNRKTDK